MRLAAWNANHNVHKRTFEASLGLLDDFHADIVVLSETAPPATHDSSATVFVGSTPGLAIVARNGYVLTPHPANSSSPPCSAGFRVSGPCSFDLLAVWPVSRKGEPSYHARLMSMLECYSNMLSSGRAVMVGDFNSSTLVSSQRRSHPRFVESAASLGLVSAYHHSTGEAHGSETISTYLHGHGAVREFHLDYGFLGEALLSDSRIEIARARDWYALGDHRPIVIDVSVSALAATSLTSASSRLRKSSATMDVIGRGSCATTLGGHARRHVESAWGERGTYRRGLPCRHIRE
jgi:hypothetical protein